MLDDDNHDLLAAASEIQHNRLYFVAFKRSFKPKNTLNTHYFCIDDDFVYENFYNDFGPLNICMLYRYCQKLKAKLNNRTLMNKKIIHYTSMNPAKRINAAYLIGAFSVIYLNRTPEEAYEPLVAGDIPAYTRFCDASYGPSTYKISLIDCINAVYRALNAGFFNFDDFDAEEYEYYERVENGDFNWIVPQKFIAFCGPHQKSKTLPNGYPCHSPETYFEYFRNNSITTVIRLNAKVYHASIFENAGFLHKDLFFIDGSTPSDLILKKFLTICETTKGAIAVHCKAGLGRTGSLIGAYIMKHYNFSALEAIAWLRLCRPGSVIGHQQQWMEDKQIWLWSEGERMRKRLGICTPIHKYGIYSITFKSRITFTANTENTELLMTRVKGIAQRVDTMNLHEDDQQERQQQLEDGNNKLDCLELKPFDNGNCKRFPLLLTSSSANERLDGTVTPPTSASDNEISETEEDLIASQLNNKYITRRRKSPATAENRPAPTISSNLSRAINVSLTVEGGSGGGFGFQRKIPPIAVEHLSSVATVVNHADKKLKKPHNSSIYDATLQRPTIASTVKMSQAALDKKTTQTQGDKLNQIKAMRRQHNSRSSGVINGDLDLPLRTRARSQPFRKNNNNLVNVLTNSSHTMPAATTQQQHQQLASANYKTAGMECLERNEITSNNLIHQYNYNNNNNNNNNIIATTTTTNNNTSTVMTTRARSLAIYSKRMGLINLHKVEQQQQQTFNNNNKINNNNKPNNSKNLFYTGTTSSTTYYHPNVTAPTLSSLNKQTKTHINTLFSSSITTGTATAANNCKIPVIRATTTLINLEAAISSDGGLGRGGNNGCCVVGSSATIPPSRSTQRLQNLNGSAKESPSSHHHMTLRGHSRIRYHHHHYHSKHHHNAATGDVDITTSTTSAQPSTITCARYYRDVSAPIAMSAVAAKTTTTITTDLLDTPANGSNGITTTRSSSVNLNKNSNGLAKKNSLSSSNINNNNNYVDSTVTLLQRFGGGGDLRSSVRKKCKNQNKYSFNNKYQPAVSSPSSYSSSSCKRESSKYSYISSLRSTHRDDGADDVLNKITPTTKTTIYNNNITNTNTTTTTITTTKPVYCSSLSCIPTTTTFSFCPSKPTFSTPPFTLKTNQQQQQQHTDANHLSEDTQANIIKATTTTTTTTFADAAGIAFAAATCIPCSTVRSTLIVGLKRNKRSLSSTRIEKDKCDEYNNKLLRKTTMSCSNNNNNISDSNGNILKATADNNNVTTTTNASCSNCSIGLGGNGSLRTRLRNSCQLLYTSSPAAQPLSSTHCISSSGISTTTNATTSTTVP